MATPGRNVTDLTRGPPPNSGEGALRILIVEDEAAARIATRRYLQYRGWSVDAAGSAEEAIRIARRRPPDVLICDWKLNGRRDGVDVARLLQSEQNVDIIFVTAYAQNELRRSAPDVRAVGCLRKPISLGALAAAVEALANGRRRIH
ncbi:MAG TPA: response regulator [Woeseiaceae bacterium]|nr:response regulator [Woeseiaceae bacterium]